MAKASYTKVATFVAAASLFGFASSSYFTANDSGAAHPVPPTRIQASDTNVQSKEQGTKETLNKDLSPQSGITSPTADMRPAKLEISRKAAKHGYGEFVNAALRSADPKNSLEAARLLKECERIDSRLEHYRSNLNSNTGVGRNNTAFLHAITNGEDIQRRCQTITKSHHEQYTKLLEAGVKGGALGAASDYYLELPAKESDRVAWLAEALKRDATSGDINAMRILACDKIGSSTVPTERLAYFQAVKEISKGSELVATHAASIIEHCASPPNLAGAVDAAMLSKLISAAEAAGADYLWN